MAISAVDIMDDAEVNGGGTYRYLGNGWYERVSLDTGYMVSQPGGVENVPCTAMTWRFVKDVIESHRYQNALNTPDTYVGLWEDEQGNWSIDISERIYFHDTALRLAVRRSQRAIWDNANGVAIDIAVAVQFGRLHVG